MNVTLPIHVSIISDHGSELQHVQEEKLNNTLCDIRFNYGRQVVLHHGCIPRLTASRTAAPAESGGGSRDTRPARLAA